MGTPVLAAPSSTIGGSPLPEALLHLRRGPVCGASSYAATRGEREMTMTTAIATARQIDSGPEEPAPAHVLIAVDETAAARRTLASGLADAAVHGADVTILHVAPARRWRTARMGP